MNNGYVAERNEDRTRLAWNEVARQSIDWKLQIDHEAMCNWLMASWRALYRPIVYSMQTFFLSSVFKRRWTWVHFYSASAIRIACNADRCNSHGISVCLSVCPARSGVLSRGMNTIVRSAVSDSTISLVSGEVKFIQIYAGESHL